MATVRLTGGRKETSSTPNNSNRDSNRENNREGRTGTQTKKVCYFCESGKQPTYTDSVTLRKFMNDRTRIVSHLRSGVCSKHQRSLTKEIKHARHLALLPFIPTI